MEIIKNLLAYIGQPILNNIAVLLLVLVITPLVIKIKLYIQDKAIYKKAQEIWNTVEEEFRLKETAEELAISKYDRFVELIKQLFPKLTDNEIYIINKSIAGVVNASKDNKLTREDLAKQVEELKVQVSDKLNENK